MTNELYSIVFYGLIYILGFFLGRMTKRNIILGVTVDDQYLTHDKVMNLKKMYIMLYSTIMTVITGIFVYMDLTNYKVYNMMIFVALWIAVASVIYVYLHGRMVKVNKELVGAQPPKSGRVISASLVNRQIEIPLINIYFIIPFLVLLVTFIVTLVNYGDLPSQIPLRYDFDGTVTQWGDKNILTIYMMVFIQLFLSILLYLATYASVKYTRRDLDSRKPKTSSIQFEIAMRRFAVVMAIILTVLNLMMGLIQMIMMGYLQTSGLLMALIIVLPIIIMIIALIIFFVTTGMTGDKIKVVIAEPEREVVKVNDDQHWKGGMIYYNKNDSSIFVPKRFGGGFTLNFANPISILCIVVILIVVVGSLLLSF
jgi:uncharacterized membrane protein